MKAWYDDIDCATLQRIKAYSAFNDATSKNLMIQTMYEYREKEIKDFKKTNHELAELYIQQKKQITELEEQIKKMKCCGNCGKWENCEKDEMFSQNICGNWELEKRK